MVLVRQRAKLKNRIHATLPKYALASPEMREAATVICRHRRRYPK